MSYGETSGDHFGIRVRPGCVQGLRMERSTYATVNTKPTDPGAGWALIQSGFFGAEEAAFRYADPTTCLKYSERYIGELIENALRNFDLHMMYFERLDQQEFEESLDTVLAAFPEFQPVIDLNQWRERPGLYIMVLDGHRQVYLGQSKDVFKRIQQHWANNKSLDRLVFGRVDESVMPVDAFRALDTTRIYTWAIEPKDAALRDQIEEQIVEHVDPRFSLNRVRGGGHGAALRGIREDGLKARDLTSTAEEWAAYWARVDATPEGREVRQYGWRRESLQRKRKPLPPIALDCDDPIRLLVQEANRRPRTSAILVDAGGTIIEFCEGPVPKVADKYMQLFVVPCGISISTENMAKAIGGARGWIGAKPVPPIELFEELGSSIVVVRRSK